MNFDGCHAHLMARPEGLRILRHDQPSRAFEGLAGMLFEDPTGIANGNGLSVLP
ncbi:hypothetical protein BurMR1_1917 [Burkholderia sp. MR1]|nr:hypothetical protein BurMR1_1917 [Burkholderia sp. MR1]